MVLPNNRRHFLPFCSNSACLESALNLCQAMEAFKRGDSALGSATQGEFIEELKAFMRSGGDHGSCPENCNLHGNCVVCVQVHRGHGDHLPYCMQCMVNKKLAVLSELTEHSIVKEVKQPAYITGKED